MSQSPSNRKSESEIQEWLVNYVSSELRIEKDQVPLDEPLVNLGMTSRQAVFLTGALEDFLEKAVDPTIIWDHPSVSKIALHLSKA